MHQVAGHSDSSVFISGKEEKSCIILELASIKGLGILIIFLDCFNNICFIERVGKREIKNLIIIYIIFWGGKPYENHIYENKI